MTFLKLTRASLKYKNKYISFINHFENNLKDELKDDFEKLIKLKKQTNHLKDKKTFSKIQMWLVDQGQTYQEVIGVFKFYTKINDDKKEQKAYVNFLINPLYKNRGLEQLGLDMFFEFLQNKIAFENVYFKVEKDDLESHEIIKDFKHKLEIKDSTYYYLINIFDIHYPLVDSHSHITSKYYKNPQKEIENIFKNQIKKVALVGIDQKDNKEILELAKINQNVYSIVGLHPTIANENQDYQEIEKLIENKTIAIGEIGLDFYRKKYPSQENQIRSFTSQLDLALKYNLPVVLHVRDAHDKIYEIISDKKYSSLTYIFHSHSGYIEWTRKFLSLNSYFSFSGVITFFENQLIHRVIKYLPLERILVESDSPYLTPSQYKNKKNHSHYVKYVIQAIAAIKQSSPQKIAKIVLDNFNRTFKL
ncbi:TatD family hydrolase [Mycoplasmopsis pulmonis]|nr:TatD family hydrolase [Mycoplasmopsis pulmonis]MDZ7293660.1 TatD family hydrolase [Mycoplasmopsis pulmonis]VEU68301.1 TatD DNase family protein [Mycoplasmopsis pulmonis]